MDMGSCYANSLAPEIALRYQEKLQLFCDNVDPYSLDPTHCSTDVDDLPNVTAHSIRSYLLLSKCPYSGRAGDAAATPDEYADPDQSGWVARTFVKNLDGITIVLGELQILDTGEFLNPWFVSFPDGYVLCAHCTCAAGTNETCLHIGGLLHRVQQLKEKTRTAMSSDASAAATVAAVKVKVERCDADAPKVVVVAAAATKSSLRQADARRAASSRRQQPTATATTVSVRRLNAVAASVAGRSNAVAATRSPATPIATTTPQTQALPRTSSPITGASTAPKPIVLNFSNGLRKINIITAKTIRSTNVAGIPVTTTMVKTSTAPSSNMLMLKRPAAATAAATTANQKHQPQVQHRQSFRLMPATGQQAKQIMGSTTTTTMATTMATATTAMSTDNFARRRRGKTRHQHNNNHNKNETLDGGDTSDTSSPGGSAADAKRARIKLYVCGICTAQFGDKDRFMQHCQRNHALPAGGQTAATAAAVAAASSAHSNTRQQQQQQERTPRALLRPPTGVTLVAKTQLRLLRPPSAVTAGTMMTAGASATAAAAQEASAAQALQTPTAKAAMRQLARLMRAGADGEELADAQRGVDDEYVVNVKREPDLQIDADGGEAEEVVEEVELEDVEPELEGTASADVDGEPMMVEEYLTEVEEDEIDHGQEVDNSEDVGGGRAHNGDAGNAGSEDDDDVDCIMINQEPVTVIVDDDDDDDDDDRDRDDGGKIDEDDKS